MNYIAPGTILNNRYIVGECIGVGGMAVVFRGTDKNSGENVALKVLKPEFSTDEQNVSRFKKEAESAYRLSHPNIVKIYGNGVCAGTHYIAMQYIDGITLTEYLEKRGAFNWKNAFEIIRQVLLALSLAHKSGVIHRDIKPQNILVDENMHVTLTDFGIAQDSINSNTINANTSACSVHYLSPEQARGTFVDKRTDIYSAGITLYEMLVGSVPFDGESAVSVALKHLQGTILPPHEVDPMIPIGVSDVVMKATMRDMGKRFQSAEEMLEQMLAVTENPNVSFWIPPLDISMLQKSGTMQFNTSNAAVESVIKPSDTAMFVGEDSLDDDVKSFEFSRSETSNSDVPENNPENSSENVENVEDLQSQETELLEEESSDELSDVSENDMSDEDLADEENDDNLAAGRRRIRIAGKIITYIVAALFALLTVAFVASTYNKVVPEASVVYRVDNYTGYKAAEVIAKLEKAGIKVIQEKKITEEYPSGYIVSQSVEAETNLSEGESLTLVISVEEGETFVESCVGAGLNIAENILKKSGLNVKVEYIPAKDKEEGTVVKTFPVAGTVLEKGETVTLYICAGRLCELVSVPDLSGMTYSEAKSALEAIGLSVGECYPSPGEDISDLFPTPTPEVTERPSFGWWSKTAESLSGEFGDVLATDETYTEEIYTIVPTEDFDDFQSVEPTMPPVWGDDFYTNFYPNEDSTTEPTLEVNPEPTFKPGFWITPEPTSEPTPEPTLEPTPEPTPEPIIAYEKVVEQYPKAYDKVYKGSFVNLYFYSSEKLSETEETVMQNFSLPSNHGSVRDILIKCKKANGTEEILGVFEMMDLPLEFEVPFAYKSDCTEIYIYIDDELYEKRIVRKP